MYVCIALSRTNIFMICMAVPIELLILDVFFWNKWPVYAVELWRCGGARGVVPRENRRRCQVWEGGVWGAPGAESSHQLRYVTVSVALACTGNVGDRPRRFVNKTCWQTIPVCCDQAKECHGKALTLQAQWTVTLFVMLIRRDLFFNEKARNSTSFSIEGDYVGSSLPGVSVLCQSTNGTTLSSISRTTYQRLNLLSYKHFGGSEWTYLLTHKLDADWTSKHFGRTNQNLKLFWLGCACPGSSARHWATPEGPNGKPLWWSLPHKK